LSFSATLSDLRRRERFCSSFFAYWWMSAYTKEKDLLYLKDGFKLRELNRGHKRPGRELLSAIKFPSAGSVRGKGF
jgi:hypothetical protein